MSVRDQWIAEAVERNIRILGRYFKCACPCQFPRFIYWVTKDHGRGTDPLQNMMIVTCRHYGETNIVQEVARDEDSGMWVCPKCETRWLDICHERSNLNFEHRFQPQDALPQPYIQQAIPPTVPVFSYERRAQEWEAFMLDGVPA
jgi:hypothetical protein